MLTPAQRRLLQALGDGRVLSRSAVTGSSVHRRRALNELVAGGLVERVAPPPTAADQRPPVTGWRYRITAAGLAALARAGQAGGEGPAAAPAAAERPGSSG